MAEVAPILLAAGRSTRMRGRDKLLEQVDGRPLLALMAARCGQVGPTRVVLAQGQTARAATLASLGVDIIWVPASGDMATSLRAGIAHLTADAAMIVLADMPGVTADHMQRIAGAYGPTRPIVRAVDEAGHPGHPTVFDRRFFPELLRISGDQGARSVLARHADQITLVPLPGDAATLDLDTPEAWEAWRNTVKTQD